MGGTTRMSADEKRKAILSIYHKTKSVYTEKEILTLASKAGVNANTVLDINQSLVDDGLVDKEKIGGSNYFWSFPAKKDRMMQIQYQKTLEEIEKLKTILAETNSRLIDAKRGREEEEEVQANDNNRNNNDTADGMKQDSENNDSGKLNNDNADGSEKENDGNNIGMKSSCMKNKMTRAAKLRRLEETRIEKMKIQNELAIVKENDPQAVADLQHELSLVQQAATRWTDNIFSCHDYLVKKRGMEKKEACRLIGITQAFDYPEHKTPK